MTDPSSYGFTGHRLRQRFREFVGSYLDTVGSGVGAPTTRAIQEQPPPARLVEDRLAEEEKLNNVDAKNVTATQGEEKLVLYPTYARVKPHLFHATHQHVPTSDHGIVLFILLWNCELMSSGRGFTCPWTSEYSAYSKYSIETER